MRLRAGHGIGPAAPLPRPLRVVVARRGRPHPLHHRRRRGRKPRGAFRRRRRLRRRSPSHVWSGGAAVRRGGGAGGAGAAGGNGVGCGRAVGARLSEPAKGIHATRHRLRGRKNTCAARGTTPESRGARPRRRMAASAAAAETSFRSRRTADRFNCGPLRADLPAAARARTPERPSARTHAVAAGKRADAQVNPLELDMGNIRDEDLLALRPPTPPHAPNLVRRGRAGRAAVTGTPAPRIRTIGPASRGCVPPVCRAASLLSMVAKRSIEWGPNDRPGGRTGRPAPTRCAAGPPPRATESRRARSDLITDSNFLVCSIIGFITDPYFLVCPSVGLITDFYF